MSDKKKYVCFTCLRESDNPDVCSNCGANIEELDLTAAQFIPPQNGFVSISKEVEADGAIMRLGEKSIEHISGLYHDVFELINDSEVIKVNCNDIAGALLVEELNKEFEQQQIDYRVFFTVT
ncbi:MAG: hypothetical protein ABW101_19265 [Candidatus Thiodiazotropha sp.]